MKFKYGGLKDYFNGIGYKRLKPVEVDPATSHEHEFNGISKFKDLFGTQRQHFPTRMIYLCDSEEDIIESETEFTWYDARENHPTRTEYRLYYQNSLCIERAEPDDLMVLCLNHPQQDRMPSLTVFVAKHGDTIESQLAWLFGINLSGVTENAELRLGAERPVDFFASLILERIGIKITEEDDDLLAILLARFPKGFPQTAQFSSFAREMVTNADCREDIDGALIAWMESEERAFRLLEKYLVQSKLNLGFRDMDDFVEFSLSVHNRRKARAGFALENHLCHMFSTLNIRYSYNKVTENKSRPDFIFPGISEYRNTKFPVRSLTMLGVKTTCKDRWRQVLNEAIRITNKHLLTLEPGISVAQTTEMQESNLQLIVPKQIFSSYSDAQQAWLISISDFVEFIKDKEARWTH